MTNFNFIFFRILTYLLYLHYFYCNFLKYSFRRPSELDALVFGHVYAILTFPAFPAGLKLAETIRKHYLVMRHCKTMMFHLDYSENIDCPVFHKLYLRRMDSGASGDLQLDEFIYDESDEDEDTSKADCTQVAQDYSCLVNEKNPIYESLFANPSNDLELGPSFIDQ